jgi:hypothetical protein
MRREMLTGKKPVTYRFFGSGNFLAAGLAAGVALLAPEFALVLPAAEAAGDASGTFAGDAAGVGVGEDCGDDDGMVSDCSTECDPLITGSERISATSMNEAAAPIVILARMLWVPRGPNAVLDTLLVNSAPASALPGCSSTATTSTRQAKMKMPNNM